MEARWRSDKLSKKVEEEEIKKMNRKIAYEARKDKKKHLLEQFNENPRDKNKKELWRSVKNLRKTFAGIFGDIA